MGCRRGSATAYGWRRSVPPGRLDPGVGGLGGRRDGASGGSRRLPWEERDGSLVEAAGGGVAVEAGERVIGGGMGLQDGDQGAGRFGGGLVGGERVRDGGG